VTATSAPVGQHTDPAQLLGRAYALSRIALGVTALVAPAPVSRGFGIGTGPGATLAGRYLGCRDLVTGIGMVLGQRHGSARGWYEAAAAIDLGDAAITVVGAVRGHMPVLQAAGVTVLALGSSAVGFTLARSEGGPTPEPLTAAVGTPST
jgi:hypothetical protein